MLLPHRNRSWLTGPLSLLLALTTCKDNVGPDEEGEPGFTFHGGGVSDTVFAYLPRAVTIELRQENGRVAAGAVISVTGRGLSTANSYYYFESVTLDAQGRGIVQVRLGTAAGTAWLVALSYAEDRTLLRADSVSFQVLPGAGVNHAPHPADTAVGMGSRYALSIRSTDRWGNVRPETSPSVTYRSLNSNTTVDASGVVTAIAVGRAAVELRTQAMVDTAWISVVPRGTLAFLGPDGERWRNHPFRGQGALQFEDLDGSNRRTVAAPVVPPANPSWSPDGSQLLLAGLQLVRMTGETVQLQADLVAGSGEFSANGEWIYFTGRRSSDPAGTTQVWRVRTSGNDLEQISPPGVNAYGGTPSPDLTRVAYVEKPSSGYARLVVRTLATGEQRIVIPNFLSVGGHGAPRWSPTGDWIAYTEGTLLQGYPCAEHYRCPVGIGISVWAQSLKVVRPDGSDVRTPGQYFLTVIGSATDPVPAAMDWSPDGEWLIGKAWYPDLRFTLVRFATGERLPLNASTVAFSMPAWKP